MGPFPPDGAAPLHRRSHTRRAEVREVLGHPRRRGKAPGRPVCPQTGGDRRCSGARCTDASDEHPLPAGNVRGCGTGHGSRPPAGHCLGGVLLLHQPAGESGAGGGGLPHQPGPGGAAVRLPDLRLCQSLPQTDPARPVCPERNAGIFVGGRGDSPPPAGGGGVYSGHLRRAAPPAPAQVPALRQGVPAPAAPRPAGLCPLCPGPPFIPEEELHPEHRRCGGHAVHGSGVLPHPRHLSAPDCRHGLYAAEKDGPRPGAPAGGLENRPARRSCGGVWRAPRPDGGHAGGGHQAPVAGGF